MSNTKVSVVMTAYNHSKYIEKALKSAVEQITDFKYVIIVGDDASPDNTQEKIKKFYKAYPDTIKPVLRKKNIGAFKNVIDLVSRCCGEYIAFLEGDDFWTSPDKLQQQVDFLDSHKEYCACFHKNSIVNENDMLIVGKDATFCNHKEYTVDDFSEFVLPGQTGTMVIRRDIIKELYSSKNMKHVIKHIHFTPGDRLMALYLLSYGRVYCFDDVMSAYRYVVKKGGTNWSSKFGGNDALGHFTYVNMRRELELCGKKLNISIDYKDKEYDAFIDACWKCLFLKKRIYFFNVIYMLLFSRHRKFLLHDGINQINSDIKIKIRFYFIRLKGKIKSKARRFVKKWPRLLRLLKRLKMALSKNQ